MAIALNHTIVASSDKHASAEFVARILGLPAPKELGHFVAVEVDNGVSLDFDNSNDVRSQHYAFLVGDDDFDPIFDRVRAEGVQFYADPGHRIVGEINTRDKGRGFYFDGPDGHNLEVLTRPYGSGS